MDVRAEFEEFFHAAYPWLVSQLHAITGDRESARWAVDTAFDGCWRSWALVRGLTDPQTWVRWAALRAAAQGRREIPFRRRPVTEPPIPADTDEGVVLAALQQLPRSQRRVVVLHYMGDVPVEELARRGATTADAVDRLLDTGFDSLVELLGWPVEEPDAEADPRYDWTAEALSDTAMRLAADVTVPDPSSVLQRAATRRWVKRAAPIAVSAACMTGVVVLAAQLNPAGAGAPRTATSYVAEPSSGSGGGYTEVRVPPVTDGHAAGGGGVRAPGPYLGTRIRPVVQSTVLEDFGVSAPADAGSSGGGAAASGSSTRSGATSAAAGGTTATTPDTGGGRTTTSPGPGSAGGTGSTTTTSPSPTSPATTTLPVTTPPATTPPDTTPPATTLPDTAPPSSTVEVPPVTTDPPVVTTTFDAPITTTLAGITTDPATAAQGSSTSAGA